MAAPPARGAMSDAVVKAGFVYNFLKFVEWPAAAFAGPLAPLQLCLLGEMDPFLAALTGIGGKTAQGREILVRRLAAPAEARFCHVLALAPGEHGQLAEALRAGRDTGSLTVGDTPGFMDAGGIIGLLVHHERVQFEINHSAAQNARLKVSAQLLKLARRVK